MSRKEAIVARLVATFRHRWDGPVEDLEAWFRVQVDHVLHAQARGQRFRVEREGLTNQAIDYRRRARFLTEYGEEAVGLLLRLAYSPSSPNPDDWT